MSCKCDGLQQLISKLETQFSDAEIRKTSREALKPVADNIEKDMRNLAPICEEHLRHGRDVIGIRWTSRYEIGLYSKSEWDLWKGLWFSEFGGGNNYKHIGWFTNFARSNYKDYMNDAKENLKKALEIKLKYDK